MSKIVLKVLVLVFLMSLMSLTIVSTASAEPGAVCPGGPGPTCIELRVNNPPNPNNTPTFTDGATTQTWPTPGVPGCLPDVTPNWPGPLVAVDTTAPVAPPISLCYSNFSLWASSGRDIGAMAASQCINDLENVAFDAPAGRLFTSVSVELKCLGPATRLHDVQVYYYISPGVLCEQQLIEPPVYAAKPHGAPGSNSYILDTLPSDTTCAAGFRRIEIEPQIGSACSIVNVWDFRTTPTSLLASIAGAETDSPDDLTVNTSTLTDEANMQVQPTAGAQGRLPEFAPNWLSPSVYVDTSAPNTAVVSQICGSPDEVTTQLIVKKVVVGETPLTDWSFIGPTGTFTLPAAGGQRVFNGLTPASYTISETLKTNYSVASACSNGASGGASVNVTLGSGQTITCVFTNTHQFTDITIVKQSMPQSSTNFRFTGSYLGGGSGSDSGGSIADFYLDDAAPDDGDAYGDRKIFTVPTGAIYSFAEPAVNGWYLASITCTPAGSATVNLATRSVTIDTSSGDDVICIFRNEKAAALTVRKYRETNGTSGQQAPEVFLSTWTIQARSSPTNTLVAQAATNALGKAAFSLKPGDYKVCEVQKSGWTQKAPASNAGCHLLLPLAPGSVTQVDFGNCPTTSCPTMVIPPVSSGETDAPVEPITFDVAVDALDVWVEQWLITPDGPSEETLEPDVSDDGDATPRVFLPVVVK